MDNYAGITLMTAGICNLNCSFCFLQNKDFLSVKEQHEKITNAWKDKTYLKTVETIFLKNNYNFNTVESISLWGGESLLNIDLVTPNIEYLYELFPNLSSWMISTNFMVNIQNFLDFLTAIDKYRKQPTIFQLQLSIDGPPGIFMEQGHNGNWEIYKNNLNKIIDFFNSHKFKNFTLSIGINSVLSKDVFLNHLDTSEKIKYYVSYMQEFLNLKEKINSQNLIINQDYSFPKLDTTAVLSVEERNKLLYIYNLFESIKHEYFDNIYNLSFSSGIHSNFVINRPLIGKNIECGGALKHSLTIMPDGIAVRCSGCYMANNEQHTKELEEKQDWKNLTVNKHETAISINLLTSSIIEQEEYRWSVLQGSKNTFNTYLKMTFGACKELLNSHQILNKYSNSEILLKHIQALSHLLACDKENVSHTNIPYMPSLNILRRYFNGLIDVSFEQEINKLTKNINNR